jgi:hypothetical protein
VLLFFIDVLKTSNISESMGLCDTQKELVNDVKVLGRIQRKQQQFSKVSL